MPPADREVKTSDREKIYNKKKITSAWRLYEELQKKPVENNQIRKRS